MEYRHVTDDELRQISLLFPGTKYTPAAVERTTRGFQVKQMYEYVEVNFAVLSALAELLKTKNIDTNLYHIDGCETCDYGSSYEVEFIVLP